MERVGGIIGLEAAKTAIAIETRPHRVVMETGGSMANFALYSKQFQEGSTHDLFKVASRKVTVPLQPLPDLSEAITQASGME